MRRVAFALLACLLCLVVVACGKAGPGGSPSPTRPSPTGSPSPSPTGSPSPAPSPTGSPLPLVELKLRVVDAVGGSIDWCDPDIYPVGHGTELQRAREALDEMQANREVYDVILEHEGIDPQAELTDPQLVRVYGDYKLVTNDTPVPLTSDGDGYRFTVIVPNRESGYDDQIEGRVSLDGAVTVERRIEGDGSSGHHFNPNCPICLARGTLISTPRGAVPVQDVRAGMAVWSTDRAGHRIRAVVVAVGHTPVPATHEVVRLVLADGRMVLVSPGHPTTDGTPVGQLRVGQRFEGTLVASAERIPYRGGYTYDLLPSGATGTYFANGVLLGSTLARPAVRSA
jgi:hypothetical protein